MDGKLNIEDLVNVIGTQNDLLGKEATKISDAFTRFNGAEV
jgi:hypothetical protein